MFKTKRSTSCPCKATHKIPQRCYYYRKYKFCKWGEHCKYIHQLYIEKPKSLATRLYQHEALTPTFDYKFKLEQIKESLRKAEIHDWRAKIRSALILTQNSLTPVV